MKASVTVREYAWLTTADLDNPSLDRQQISSTAFEWLCKLSSSLRQSGQALVQLEDHCWLKLDNYVGVVETPCGTQIEILPKHLETDDSISATRALLRRMLETVLDIPSRELGPAHLQLFDSPLTEWVIQRFLHALDHLIKRGARFDYRWVEEDQRFLRGQLNLAKQIRQGPGHQHHFHIRHDIFSADRPENRLLKLALDRVCTATRIAENWRLACELRSLLGEIPASTNIKEDFSRWRTDRLMAHYQQAKPWCDLILSRQMPAALVGDWEGMSLLFPMETLFERYVGACLRKDLCDDAQLRAKLGSQYLCEHDGGKMFRLEPDFLVVRKEEKWILDTKWKLLNSAERANNYGLSQSDFYQLFAYGRTYLGDQRNGRLALIYPKRTEFSQALPVFRLRGELSLWVLPFNMEAGLLEGFAQAGLPLKRDTKVNAAA